MNARRARVPPEGQRLAPDVDPLASRLRPSQQKVSVLSSPERHGSYRAGSYRPVSLAAPVAVVEPRWSPGHHRRAWCEGVTMPAPFRAASASPIGHHASRPCPAGNSPSNSTAVSNWRAAGRRLQRSRRDANGSPVRCCWRIEGVRTSALSARTRADTNAALGTVGRSGLASRRYRNRPGSLWSWWAARAVGRRQLSSAGPSG